MIETTEDLENTAKGTSMCGKPSEIDQYFQLRRDVERAEQTLVQLGGTGMFIDEFNPAIYRLRGMLSGMDTTMRSFDL